MGTNGPVYLNFKYPTQYNPGELPSHFDPSIYRLPTWAHVMIHCKKNPVETAGPPFLLAERALGGLDAPRWAPTVVLGARMATPSE